MKVNHSNEEYFYILSFKTNTLSTLTDLDSIDLSSVMIKLENGKHQDIFMFSYNILVVNCMFMYRICIYVFLYVLILMYDLNCIMLY